MPLRRLDRRDHLPVFELTRVTTLIDPYAEVPVGRHHDEDDNGIADQSDRRTFTRDDGSAYERIPAAEIEDCDDVDSTTIVDEGAPA